MHELEKMNAFLKAEADVLLNQCGLLMIMGKYGTPRITGSYALDLMTRRDLDINLGTDNMTEKRFFRMGGEIATALKARRMLYLNEFNDRHPRLPLGLYMGVYTRIIGQAKEWCIDIWAVDTGQENQYKQFVATLQAGIDDTKRLLILEIKSKSVEHPGYQHKYFSLDIYNAVINEGVKTPEEFFKWVNKYRSTDISI